MLSFHLSRARHLQLNQSNSRSIYSENCTIMPHLFTAAYLDASKEKMLTLEKSLKLSISNQLVHLVLCLYLIVQFAMKSWLRIQAEVNMEYTVCRLQLKTQKLSPAFEERKNQISTILPIVQSCDIACIRNHLNFEN